MRIVYLLSYFELVGGQELYLAREQAQQGHEVFVVAAALYYPLANIRERYAMEGIPLTADPHTPGRYHWEGFTITRLPVIFHYQDFILVHGVGALLRELRPDAVFGHEPRTIVPALGARYKNELGYVYYLDVHDLFHAVQNHQWWQRFLRYAEYFWWRKFFVAAALKRADRIIAVAPDCKKFLHERCHIPNEQIDELPLGVATDIYQFTAEGRQHTRSRLGIQPNEIVLIFSGYMFRRKALESLLDLVARVHDIPLSVLLVGDGPPDYLRELQQQTERVGVGNRVRFYGFASRKEIAELYSAADIGIWPGNNTLAILEAMACRLPIIIAKMQLAHLTSHGNGLTVPYADTQAMEDAVRKMAADPTLRQTMGAKSEAAVRSHYSYEALARQVSAWMEKDLAQRVR